MNKTRYIFTAVAQWTLLISFLLVGGVSFAQSGKAVPQIRPSDGFVLDLGNVLTEGEERALERKLLAFNDTTSTQIAILTDRSLEGEDIFDYSLKVAREWGVGQEKKNNGILIYLAVQDRQIFIQTGYGAEGFLPDILASRIIEQVIKPAFRQGQYYTGLDQGTEIIIKSANGEYVNDTSQRDEFPIPPELIMFLIILIILVVFRSNNDDDDEGYYRGGRYDGYGRRRSRRGGGMIFFPTGGFGGGGGGGFGGGGGGFGGFGGGGFGGGGAGGSW